MANQDPPIVREFKAFGMRHIREQLAAAEGRFVDKAAAYDEVVAGFKAEYGWPADLTELERTVGGKLREVYINRLHWMTARLCREGVIESVASRPFIALAGHLAAAEAAYGSKTQKRRRGRPKAPMPDGARVQTSPANQIVEDVPKEARTPAQRGG